jgi:hypothetical protein
MAASARRLILTTAVAVSAAGFGLAPAPTLAAPVTPVIRVGGPSAPADPKIAVVGSSTDLTGQPFTVVDAANATVANGVLAKASGNPAPFAFAETADLSSVTAPGTYTVEVGSTQSAPWVVQGGGSLSDVAQLLNLYNANADGNEASNYHSPSHLNDGHALLVGGGPSGKHYYDVTGGWMDAGDMVKSTGGIAYTVLLLEQAAALDAPDAPALRAAAEVGLRFLLKAHPAVKVWIGQVGDANVDHNTLAGPDDHSLTPIFRRPELDDTRTVDVNGNPVSDLIRHREAHFTTDATSAGKAAAALAFASRFEPNSSTLLSAATAWFQFGQSHLSSTRKAKSNIIYSGDKQAVDDLGLAGAALYNATGTSTYLKAALTRLKKSSVGSGPDLLDTDPYGEAILCGAFGGFVPPGTVSDPSTQRGAACGLLAEAAQIAQGRADATAFATPGEFIWGHNCRSAANAAVALLAGREGAGITAGSANLLGVRARDYLLGLNPWGQNFLVGPGGVQNPHHWTETRGPGEPTGELVGGPDSQQDIAAQGLTVPQGPYDSPNAAYADDMNNYVNSEGDIECQAEGILLFAQLQG